MNNFSHLLERLSSRAKAALVAAQKLSEDLRHAHTGTEHLLYAILAEKSAFGGEILLKNNLDPSHIKETVSKLNSDKVVEVWSARISENFRISLEKAAVVASRFNYPYIATEHILFGILDCEDSLGRKIMAQRGLDVVEMKSQLLAIFDHSSKFPDFGSVEEQLPASSVTRTKPEEKISKSPALDYFTTDLTERATLGKIDPVIGRATEIERLVAILNRRNKNNPVLIGEPGVGKTAIVEGLALAIVKGEVPESLLDKKILALDLALVVAGSMFRGEFENRLKQVIDEVSEDKNIILFIDELHTLVGAGATTGSLDAANILKPALARGDLRAIGATTLAEYKKYIENDAALERRFQPILVDEPSPEEAAQIIHGVLNNYEKYHGVSIAPEAVKAAVELSVRYIPDRFLPDKALDLIDETAANLKTKNEKSPELRFLKALEKELYEISREKTKAVLSEDVTAAKLLRLKEEQLREQQQAYHDSLQEPSSATKLRISTEDIAKTVSLITKIPLHTLVQAEIDKLVNLDQSLKSRVVGQDEAIETIVGAIKRSRLGLSSPNRPLGSFVFMGPSGVGKTELAKALAEEIFQNREALIRVDMSEFMEKHNVARLIGAPAGYVGFEEGGRLTEAIRRKPYAIVLFDEIEKAHPDVFNILLQILEEGQLTDAGGKRVNFKNTIIIMTSNIGLTELNRDAAGFGFVDKEELERAREQFDQTKERVIESLKDLMRPELLNRIDKILVFKPLESNHLKSIVEIQLKDMQKRLLERGIDVAWDKKSVAKIADLSLNSDEGARMVRKNLQELIEAKIASSLLKNAHFLSSNKTIKAKISWPKKEIDIKFKVSQRGSRPNQTIN